MVGLSPKGLVSLKEKEEIPEILCDACTEKKPCKDIERRCQSARQREASQETESIGNSVWGLYPEEMWENKFLLLTTQSVVFGYDSPNRLIQENAWWPDDQGQVCSIEEMQIFVCSLFFTKFFLIF